MKKICQQLGEGFVLQEDCNEIVYTINDNSCVKINKQHPQSKRFTISFCNGNIVERQIYNIPFVRIIDWIEDYKYMV
jgi:hypothetical protein